MGSSLNGTGESLPMLPPVEGDIAYPFEDVSSGDENKIRGNWSSKIDFVLSGLGFVVGKFDLGSFSSKWIEFD